MRQSHLLNREITDLACLTSQIALQDSLALCLLRARVAGGPPPYLSGLSGDPELCFRRLQQILALSTAPSLLPLQLLFMV